ncbi:unnamed protein product [Scytosiphon promiscuus]
MTLVTARCVHPRCLVERDMTPSTLWYSRRSTLSLPSCFMHDPRTTPFGAPMLPRNRETTGAFLLSKPAGKRIYGSPCTRQIRMTLVRLFLDNNAWIYLPSEFDFLVDRPEFRLKTPTPPFLSSCPPTYLYSSTLPLFPSYFA